MGRSLLQIRRFADAEAHFRRALELDPNNAISHNNLGLALQRQGRAVEAVHAFDAAARIDPASDLARTNLFRQTSFVVVFGSVIILLVGLVLAGAFALIDVTTQSLALAAVITILLGLGIAVAFYRRRPGDPQRQLPRTAREYFKAEMRRRRKSPGVGSRMGIIPIIPLALLLVVCAFAIALIDLTISSLVLVVVTLTLLGLAVAVAFSRRLPADPRYRRLPRTTLEYFKAEMQRRRKRPFQ
jgi:tetratricopeptide (TPR) repeat protein